MTEKSPRVAVAELIGLMKIIVSISWALGYGTLAFLLIGAGSEPVEPIDQLKRATWYGIGGFVMAVVTIALFECAMMPEEQRRSRKRRDDPHT